MGCFREPVTLEEIPDPRSGLTPPLFVAAIHLWSQSRSELVVTVSGNSMWPILQEGDQIRIHPGCERIKRGDIVAYLRKGRLITHRLIGPRSYGEDDFFLLKGDNLPIRDPAVRINAILGRVVALKRHDKWLVMDSHFWRSMNWVVANISVAQELLFRLLRRIFNVRFK